MLPIDSLLQGHLVFCLLANVQVSWLFVRSQRLCWFYAFTAAIFSELWSNTTGTWSVIVVFRHFRYLPLNFSILHFISLLLTILLLCLFQYSHSIPLRISYYPLVIYASARYLTLFIALTLSHKVRTVWLKWTALDRHLRCPTRLADLIIIGLTV